MGCQSLHVTARSSRDESKRIHLVSVPPSTRIDVKTQDSTMTSKCLAHPTTPTMPTSMSMSMAKIWEQFEPR